MKKFRNVTLVLAGFVLGVAVSFSPQIQAAANKLVNGAKVQKVLDVKINNKSIGDGGVIDGTTYIPLRTAANSMGLEVAKVDSKEVNLIPANGSSSENDLAEKARLEQEELKKKEVAMNEIVNDINNTKARINEAENYLSDNYRSQAKRWSEIEQQSLEIYERMYAADPNEANRQRVENSKATIAKYNDNIKWAEENLSILKQRLADLEIQLRKLKGD